MIRSALATALLSLPAAAWAEPVTYDIDPTHTLPTFEISHLGFSTTRGSFTDAKGTIVLDRAANSGSVEVTIDASSLQTAVPKMTDHLKNADFFDVEKYPTISFKSDRLTFDGEALKRVDGELTMHGVTRPVSLEVTHFLCKDHPMRKVPHCGADASAQIRRSDWGIKTFLPAIPDEVTLRIQVEASQRQ